MRIFLVCLQSPHRYRMSPYHFWHDYFARGLAESGHEVLECGETDWARGLVNLTKPERTAWLTASWERTIAALRREQENGGVDLFLSYLYPNQIEPTAIPSIRALGIPCVNFFCDNVREYRHLPPEFAPFDLHWVPEHAALALYATRGWPHLHAPMPCWIRPDLRTAPPSERPVVSFVGSRDSLREPLLAAVARSGLPLEIRGGAWLPHDEPPAFERPPISPGERATYWRQFLRNQGWGATWRRVTARFHSDPVDAFDFAPFVQPSPPADAYQQIVAESAVSLGINRYRTFQQPAARVSTYSRLRDIEAPMLGACYLTEWTEGLDTLYELGTEIETYRDAPELVAKAQSLLADPARRRRMRVAAQRRALSDHTVGRTIEHIAQKLGLPH